MYLDNVGKGHAVEGISLSRNAMISSMLFWVNDYWCLCNLDCGKIMGCKPMGTNTFCRFNGLCNEIFLAEAMWYLGSYDLTVSIRIVIYMTFNVNVNCTPHTLVVVWHL